MDFDFVANGLAKLLVESAPLLQCYQVASRLHSLLDQRRTTIRNLNVAADKLDKHYKNSAIAKTVGSVAGTGGKIATGIGVASLLGAPFTGGLSLVVSAGCALVGGGFWASGALVQAGTYSTEYFLCKTELKSANQAIARDQSFSEELQRAWEGLESMLSSFCEQFPSFGIEKALKTVWEVFQKINNFVDQSGVNWKGIVKACNSETGQNLKRSAIGVVKRIIQEVFKGLLDTTLKTVGFPVFAGIAVVGVGAALIGLDVFVFARNTYRLASGEPHPGAVKIRSTIEELERENDKLQRFGGALEQTLRGAEH